MIRTFIHDRLFRRTLLLLLLLCGLMFASTMLHATTVSGTFKVNGTPFNGYMTFQLNYPATTTAYINLPVESAPITITQGVFASLALDGNDTMLPSGTYYAFNFYDQYGGRVTRLNYAITGTTFDLGQAIPTPVLTNNVSFLDLLGLRSLSVLNASFINSISVGQTTLSSLGLSNAQNINGTLYAAAYNVQHPTSGTCGIQEAENDLPTTGGTIQLPSGTCNTSVSVIISKPTVLIGFGRGGYADSSSFTTFSSPTVINQTSLGQAVFNVTPAAGTTLSGIHFKDFAISYSGATGGSGLVILGNQLSTTAFLRDVDFDGMLIRSSGTDGVDIAGNAYGIAFRNTDADNNANSGVAVQRFVSGQVSDHITFGPNFNALHNGIDGVQLDGNATGLVTADSVNCSFNGSNGIAALFNVTGTTTSLKVIGSSFNSNLNAGILLATGTGHNIQSSIFTGASAQHFGVLITNAPTTNFQNLMLKDNSWFSNLTFDISVTNSAYVLYYPQVTQTPTIDGTVVAH